MWNVLNSYLYGTGSDLSGLVEIEREDVGEAGGVGVQRSSTVAERLQQQRDGVQLLHWKPIGKSSSIYN